MGTNQILEQPWSGNTLGPSQIWRIRWTLLEIKSILFFSISILVNRWVKGGWYNVVITLFFCHQQNPNTKYQATSLWPVAVISWWQYISIRHWSWTPIDTAPWFGRACSSHILTPFPHHCPIAGWWVFEDHLALNTHHLLVKFWGFEEDYVKAYCGRGPLMPDSTA